MSTKLTVVERAKQALAITKTEEQLKALAAQSVTITAITNADGYQQVHTARMVLKNTRVEIQNLGKDARDDATKFSKAVIAEEKRLIALIEPEESRLQELQDGYDAAIEAEKQAKIAAEMKRVQGIRDRIEMDIRRAAATSSSAMPSERIAAIIKDVAAIVVDESFAEFEQEAIDAKVASIARLREIHTAAVEREAEQARIKAEREELARLRAEERARIAEEERQAKAIRDAEAAKQAEEIRQMRIAQETAAAAERKRIAEEEAGAKAVRDAEAKKLAAERAEFERQQAEARRIKDEEERAKREQARLASIKKPADDELLGVIARHYSVPQSKVIEWLLAVDFSSLEVAA